MRDGRADEEARGGSASAQSQEVTSNSNVSPSSSSSSDPSVVANSSNASATSPSSSSSSTPSSSPHPEHILCLPRPVALSLGVALFYAFCSLALALLNKALLSAFNFNGYFFLLAAQMGLSLVLCVITRDFMGNPFRIPAYDPSTHRAGAGMGVLYVVNVGAGLVALQMVNVPMFSCIRRLASPVIIAYEYVSAGKVQTRDVQASIGLILAGTLIAGWDTLSSDIIGYAITMLNNVCTAASSVTQKKFSETAKLSAFGVLYYNAWTALPLAAALSVATGEVAALPSFQHIASTDFWGGFAVACSLGPLLTYSSMLSTTYNSPLATSVTGNVKDVATTLLGAVLFPGFIATAKSVGGLLLSFIGAGAYSYISLQRMRKGNANSSNAVPPASAAAAGDGEETKKEKERQKATAAIDNVEQEDEAEAEAEAESASLLQKESKYSEARGIGASSEAGIMGRRPSTSASPPVGGAAAASSIPAPGAARGPVTGLPTTTFSHGAQRGGIVRGSVTGVSAGIAARMGGRR